MKITKKFTTFALLAALLAGSSGVAEAKDRQPKVTRTVLDESVTVDHHVANSYRSFTEIEDEPWMADLVDRGDAICVRFDDIDRTKLCNHTMWDDNGKSIGYGEDNLAPGKFKQGKYDVMFPVGLEHALNSHTELILNLAKKGQTDYARFFKLEDGKFFAEYYVKGTGALATYDTDKKLRVYVSWEGDQIEEIEMVVENCRRLGKKCRESHPFVVEKGYIRVLPQYTALASGLTELVRETCEEPKYVPGVADLE